MRKAIAQTAFLLVASALLSQSPELPAALFRLVLLGVGIPYIVLPLLGPALEYLLNDQPQTAQ